MTSFWMIFKLSYKLKWLISFKDAESLQEWLKVWVWTRHSAVKPEMVLEAIWGKCVCVCVFVYLYKIELVNAIF